MRGERGERAGKKRCLYRNIGQIDVWYNDVYLRHVTGILSFLFFLICSVVIHNPDDES